MIELHPSQYPSYQEMKSIIDRQLQQQIPSDKILKDILLTGQEMGFCIDEMWQIIDLSSE